MEPSIYARRLRPEILAVAASHGATDVRVFGSAARNELHEGSDLVRMEEGRTLFDLIALGQELEDRLGVTVDVISQSGLSPYLRDRILSGAVPL